MKCFDLICAIAYCDDDDDDDDDVMDFDAFTTFI